MILISKICSDSELGMVLQLTTLATAEADMDKGRSLRAGTQCTTQGAWSKPMMPS
jgi:hypothetical protein